MEKLRSNLVRAVFIFLLILLVLPSAYAVGLDDKVAGYSLDDLARAFAVHGDIRATYGEANEDAPFGQWLSKALGSSTCEYDQAYSEWGEHFEADESGKLEARFLTLNQKYSLALQFADTEDKSQEVREGVTLEKYAKIAVAITQQPNADINAVLEQHGIKSAAEWQKVNTAWVQAMSKDGIIATQYGLLYQKFAGPSFAAQQEAQLASQLGGHHSEEAEDAEEDDVSESGPQFYAQELSSPVAKDRWYAANRMLFHCSRFRDFGDDEGLGLAELCSDSAISGKVVPVIKELLATYENDQIETATSILDLVDEMELKKRITRDDLTKALSRANDQYNTVKAEYEPIQHKNVPNKSILRARMDATAYSIGEFEDKLSGWD